ncbi:MULTISPECIES: glycosyltransferase [Burkholderia]|uniref:Glycosyl transferase family 2 n=1 Tax=Burkholderia pyrrocinia TaxID=60550 RepID=A0A318I4E4_BURPY|nr:MULTISPECIES: glycosyltransferase [Burkholderia]PXX25836.1 glycosyl transferase family 2 [Burkholderia pyrrocinia]SFW83703.1 Glycosyl transferase family 2 [Burkholderia sp. NFACC33-1]SFY44764.1 Glycosyl transferase family 2 [Burkholderia sp. NFPP32]
MKEIVIKSDDRPVISVVVMCYNLERYIGECLESVLSQEIDVPFEIIVGDDGSADNSVSVIESIRYKFPGVITLITHEHNIGYSRNLADIMAHASGEYIATIDGDDLMLPGKLARQFEFLETQREFGMVVHRMRTVDALNGEPVNFPLARVKPAVFDAEFLIEHGPFFFTSSVMFRGALRRRHAIDLELKVVADVANLVQCLHGSRAAYLDQDLGVYRVNPNGFTSTVIRNPARHETNILDLMRTCNMAEALGMKPEIVDRGRAGVFLRSAILYLENGFYDQFEHCIRKSTEFADVGVKQQVLYAMRHRPKILRSLYAFAKQVAGRSAARA